MVDGFHLPEHVSAVSLRALGSSTRQFLAIYLDPPSCTVNDDGVTADASGLAELAGFDNQTIRYFESKSSRTSELLNMWRYRQNGTLGNLVGYLLQLERFDCLTDIWQKLLTDAYKWTKRSRARDSSCSVESFTGNGPSTESLDGLSASAESESNFLTVDDVNAGQIQMYSACVCCADADLGLARDIVRELSKNSKLFIPQDHLVGGAYEFEATAEVIEDRCDGRLVVLLSNHYNNSPACSFATQFAKALDPDARRRRVIPVVTQEGANFPRILRGISTIKYYRCESMTSFLTQIIASLSYKSPSNKNGEARKTSAQQNRNISTFSSKTSMEFPKNSSVISTPTGVSSCNCVRRSSLAADRRNSNVSIASMISNESRITNNRSSLCSSNDSNLMSSAVRPGCELSCRSKILNISPNLLNMNENEESQFYGENCSTYSSTLPTENNFGRSKYNDLSPGSDVMARQLLADCNKVPPTSKLNITFDQNVSVETTGVKTQNNMKPKSSIIATFKRVFARFPSQKHEEKSCVSKDNAESCHAINTPNIYQPSASKVGGTSSESTEILASSLPVTKPSEFQQMAQPSQSNRRTIVCESDVIFV
ncbi:uncharacterized protein LOC117321976 [Pecten maximus]|uniref:uncharacterized protein LOC117321976 n=1 Tax=Pecten maximus TaxID=6579 RepID=UPI00145917BE|nr:uncharacterized protein LOC117321976 [Pecten maximus]